MRQILNTYTVYNIIVCFSLLEISEISRQQLEHKLDKILQKRDEQ